MGAAFEDRGLRAHTVATAVSLPVVVAGAAGQREAFRHPPLVLHVRPLVECLAAGTAGCGGGLAPAGPIRYRGFLQPAFILAQIRSEGQAMAGSKAIGVLSVAEPGSIGPVADRARPARGGGCGAGSGIVIERRPGMAAPQRELPAAGELMVKPAGEEPVRGPAVAIEKCSRRYGEPPRRAVPQEGRRAGIERSAGCRS